LGLGLELVITRADRVDGSTIFHTQKLHAIGLANGLAGFGDAGGVFGRDENRRCCIRRDRDIHREFFALAFPIAHDATVGRVVVCIHPLQIADDVGLDDDVFETGRV